VTDDVQTSADPEHVHAVLESQDRLISSVAHELRTPLSAVVGLSAELRDQASSMPIAEVVSLASIIAEQSTVIAAILEDLLAAARMRGTGLTVSMQVVDLGHEARTAVASLGVGDRVSIEGTGQACGDPLRVRQVIRNLISNALRYGGVEVTVRIQTTSGAEAAVSVLDNGKGIDEERVASIFDAFERTHLDPGRPGSMGLGLTVARGLARLMNGDIVYKRTNDLTNFELRLPAPAVPAELRELVYQSRANNEMSTADLEELLRVARRNNQNADLTGLLLYHEGDFLQVLEGPADKVDEVFGVIRNDPRHYRVNTIVDRTVSARSFADWQMAYYEITDPLDSAEGVSKFLSGADLPPNSSRYVQMLFEAFRDNR
jgi:hypothetical protein